MRWLLPALLFVFFPFSAALADNHHHQKFGGEIAIGTAAKNNVSLDALRFKRLFFLKEFHGNEFYLAPQLVIGRTEPAGALFGLEITFRGERKIAGSLRFFLEGGAGTNAITAHHKIDEISGLLQFSSGGRAGISLPLTQSSLLEIGGGFTHYSNAGMKKPNTGLNIPYIFLGVRF